MPQSDRNGIWVLMVYIWDPREGKDSSLVSCRFHMCLYTLYKLTHRRTYESSVYRFNFLSYKKVSLILENKR